MTKRTFGDMAASRATDLSSARTLIEASSKIAVLTGAGISTDSGIPDFRGPDGLWTKNPGAEEASNIEVFRVDSSARKAFWRMMVMMQGQGLKPNLGHQALVELEKQEKLALLITQNVDGLHQAAGNSPSIVVEVHGGTTESKCLSCGDVRSMATTLERVKAGEADPKCSLCGGLLKANVVLFGESLPEEAIERAFTTAQECDLIICIGSTLSVFPVAGVVPVAIQNGAKLIIVNQGETEFDHVANVLLSGSISEILPALFDRDSKL